MMVRDPSGIESQEDHIIRRPSATVLAANKNTIQRWEGPKNVVDLEIEIQASHAVEAALLVTNVVYFKFSNPE